MSGRSSSAEAGSAPASTSVAAAPSSGAAGWTGTSVSVMPVVSTATTSAAATATEPSAAVSSGDANDDSTTGSSPPIAAKAERSSTTSGAVGVVDTRPAAWASCASAIWFVLEAVMRSSTHQIRATRTIDPAITMTAPAMPIASCARSVSGATLDGSPTRSMTIRGITNSTSSAIHAEKIRRPVRRASGWTRCTMSFTIGGTRKRLRTGRKFSTKAMLGLVAG